MQNYQLFVSVCICSTVVDNVSFCIKYLSIKVFEPLSRGDLVREVCVCVCFSWSWIYFWIYSHKCMVIYYKWQNLSVCTATATEIIPTSRNASLPLLLKNLGIFHKRRCFSQYQGFNWAYYNLIGLKNQVFLRKTIGLSEEKTPLKPVLTYSLGKINITVRGQLPSSFSLEA